MITCFGPCCCLDLVPRRVDAAVVVVDLSKTQRGSYYNSPIFLALDGDGTYRDQIFDPHWEVALEGC